MNSSLSPKYSFKFSDYIIPFIYFALIALGIYLIVNAFLAPVPEDTKDIQEAKIEERYSKNERGPLSTSTVAALPANQQLLINTQVFATRYAGYLGPLRGGVFAPVSNTNAYMTHATGFRLIVLEFAMEPDHVTPKLVAVDGQGIYGEVGGNEKKSNYLANYIAGLRESIDARADPVILYLHFHSYPNAATEPRNYWSFTSTIAESLRPLDPYLLGDSPTGNYGRQGLESKLFLTPIADLGSKPVILITNMDTTPSRKQQGTPGGIQGMTSFTHDLDLKVHARVYGEGDTLKGKPAVFAAPASYWLTTPETMMTAAQERCKETFSIVFPVAPGELSKAQINTLYNVYGVHAVAFPMFDDAAVDLWGPESPHRKSAWLAKPESLRYIPPAPIQISEASPKTNSGGGRIQAPKL